MRVVVNELITIHYLYTIKIMRIWYGYKIVDTCESPSAINLVLVVNDLELSNESDKYDTAACAFQSEIDARAVVRKLTDRFHKN